MTLPLALAIGIISAAALAYEITLMRLFSISYWSHFAWMIISMAMLGYGASGVLVALAGRQMAGARFRPLFAAAAMLFGLFSILGFSMAGRSGFNPLELLWDPAQKFWLLYMYLWLFIPFFMAASCVGICFIRFKERTSQVYLFDLTGAGIGSLAVVIGMYYLFSWQVLSFIAFAGFLAAALSMLDVTLGARRPVVALAILATGAAWAFAWPGAHLRPVISPYKGLSMALASPTAKVLGEVTSPLAQLTVVEDKRIPFRQAPGLSLMDQHGPPGQLAVYVDGGSGAAITYAGGGVESLSFLDNMPQAAPYHLKKGASVLILAAGGGLDVLMALTLGAEHVDAVEMDPGMAGLVSGPYARFAGGIYSHPKVNLRISEARRVVSVTQERYHIIQAPLAGAFGASVGGAAAVSESYLYTVEGIEDYMAHLRPEGWLVATRWLTSPPRESLKLLATVASALDKTGVRDP
ncbi:MAG: SAM-dependent methyltransferase, partial [Nitrospinota bacterium]|nr:SAM-dependent methyltransferase [Nitrospinota bacterium]